MEDPGTNRCATTVHPGPRTLDMAGQDRLVDDESAIERGESFDRLEVNVGDRIEDPRIDRADSFLPFEGRSRVRDVVPDDVIRVGCQRRFDIVGILGCEMPIDDVQRGSPFSLLAKGSGRWRSSKFPRPFEVD